APKAAPAVKVVTGIAIEGRVTATAKAADATARCGATVSSRAAKAASVRAANRVRRENRAASLKWLSRRCSIRHLPPARRPNRPALSARTLAVLRVQPVDRMTPAWAASATESVVAVVVAGVVDVAVAAHETPTAIVFRMAMSLRAAVKAVTSGAANLRRA